MKMIKIFIAILKALKLIHTENVLILATLVDKDVEDKIFDNLNKTFDEIMREADLE